MFEWSVAEHGWKYCLDNTKEATRWAIRSSKGEYILIIDDKGYAQNVVDCHNKLAKKYNNLFKFTTGLIEKLLRKI